MIKDDILLYRKYSFFYATCYLCNLKGHIARDCEKLTFAFLRRQTLEAFQR